MRKIFLVCFVFLLSCAPKQAAVEKEKMLWIAEASFMTHLSTREKIVATMDRIEAAGFNSIAVDVRPVEGDVLYRSDFMAPFEDAAERDYDYLQLMIDEAHKRGIEVTAAATIFTAGQTLRPKVEVKEGPVFRDPALAALACVEYTPDKGMISILDDDGKEGAGGFGFLNPLHPEAQKYALSFVEEIVRKYDIDGFSLDYCRYPDAESDFSDFTRERFEAFIGAEVENWPADIFTYDDAGKQVAGVHYYAWWQFRAETIHDFVAAARDAVKALKPEVKLVNWTGSWIARDSGQNWASRTYDLAADPEQGEEYREWLTADYSKAALAELLDTYLLGSYVTDTYMDGPEDPLQSLEYQIARGKKYVNGAVPMYGNVTATNTPEQIEEQVYYCLANSDGLMVFDLSHFATDDEKWDAIERGIEKSEKIKK